MLGINNIIVQI